MGQRTLVTIAASGTLSDAAILQGDLKFICIPASMTGTTLKIHGSYDGTTYTVLKDTSGNDLSITIGSAIAIIPVAGLNLVGLRAIKLLSGSAETGAKVITLITD